MCCTVQHCILWMLHCKKSPSPVTHSKTHVFCEGEETGNGKFYSYRSVPGPVPRVHSKGGYYKDHASRLSPGGVWRFCILWLTIRTPCTKKRRKRRPASKTPDALPLRRRGQKDAGRLCLQYSRCYIFTTVHTGSVCTQNTSAYCTE